MGPGGSYIDDNFSWLDWSSEYLTFLLSKTIQYWIEFGSFLASPDVLKDWVSYDGLAWLGSPRNGARVTRPGLNQINHFLFLLQKSLR